MWLFSNVKDSGVFAKMVFLWYVYNIIGGIQMTQMEEIIDMRDYGYTIDQISVLVGISREQVERVINGVDIRIC